VNHSTAPEPHPSRESDDSPHVCNNGWVSMEVESLDPDTGEETLEEVLYLCRRCSGDGSR
jgi:hypothetical protein